MSKKEDISPPDFAVATKAEAEETEPLVPVAVASPAKVPPTVRHEITTPCVTTWGLEVFVYACIGDLVTHPHPYPTKTNSNGCVGLGVIGVNEGGKVVIINVGGQRHEALKKNFDKFPQEQTEKQTDTHRCRNNLTWTHYLCFMF